MKLPAFAFAFAACAVLGTPAAAETETREEYLAKLREICAVDCLQPRQLQRKARKRDKRDQSDMAIIMDVAIIQRAGDKIELHNSDQELSYLEEQAALGAAGINTSGRNGTGGLPAGRLAGRNPFVVIVEMGDDTLFDLLAKRPEPTNSAPVRNSDGSIVVEQDRDQKIDKPTLADLQAAFLNRRIVVRGQPRLEVRFKGGRRDYRNKQVILQLDNADDIALLPRYDDEGNPLREDLPWMADKADG